MMVSWTFHPPKNQPWTFHRDWFLVDFHDWNFYKNENALSIQVCPKKGINPTVLLWGWDWDHQSYSRDGSGCLGMIKLMGLCGFFFGSRGAGGLCRGCGCMQKRNMRRHQMCWFTCVPFCIGFQPYSSIGGGFQHFFKPGFFPFKKWF